jgi:hypothetical protein
MHLDAQKCNSSFSSKVVSDLSCVQVLAGAHCSKILCVVSYRVRKVGYRCVHGYLIGYVAAEVGWW